MCRVQRERRELGAKPQVGAALVCGFWLRVSLAEAGIERVVDRPPAYTRFRRASLQLAVAVSAPTARAISAMHLHPPGTFCLKSNFRVYGCLKALRASDCLRNGLSRSLGFVVADERSSLTARLLKTTNQILVNAKVIWDLIASA